ncbi:MAG: hypothetical protein ABJA78_17875 [Ferruginibacter sp.]
MKKGNAFLIIIFTLLIGGGIYFEIGRYNLRHHGILLNGRTMEWEHGGSNVGLTLQFEFYYNGERIVGDDPYPEINGRSIFDYKFFPVMYEPESGLSEMLILPLDFKRYNMKFPDSLNWVLKYVKK